MASTSFGRPVSGHLFSTFSWFFRSVSNILSGFQQYVSVSWRFGPLLSFSRGCFCLVTILFASSLSFRKRLDIREASFRAGFIWWEWRLLAVMVAAVPGTVRCLGSVLQYLEE